MGGIYRFVVGALNQAPTWTQPSFSAFPGGQQTSQSFANFVSDPDTPTINLTFAKVGTWPAWLTLSSTSILCATNAPVTTITGLVISASDGTTVVNSPAFSVQVVKATNRPPSWTQSIPSQPMNPTPTTPATFDFRSVTADLDGDALSYQPLNPVTLPAGFSINGPLLQCTTTAANGAVALQFRAWDGGAVGSGASTDSPAITFIVQSSSQSLPVWSTIPPTLQASFGSPASVATYCSGALQFAISPNSPTSATTLSNAGITLSSSGLFTVSSSASAATTGQIIVRATNSAGTADSGPFAIQVIVAVSGPFAIQVQYRRAPGRPTTFAVGAYAGPAGAGKHWAYNKVGNRWYSVNGDNNLPAVPDPETFWNYEQGTGYNNECIPSVDLTDDDSWCFQIRRHADLTQSEFQWFRPDDCFACVRTAPQNGDPVEIFGFWGNGTYSFNSIIQNCVNGTETHAPNLILEIPGSTASTWVQPAPGRAKMFGNVIAAFDPKQSLGNGKGAWRRKTHVDIPEYKTGGTWRAIYDPIRDKFLIPTIGGSILVYDPITDKDMTPRGTGGTAILWRYNGDDPSMQYFGRFGGFIRNDILYIIDNLGQNLLHFSVGIPSAINNLLALDLTQFFAWVNSGTLGTINVVTQPRPNILTKVQRLPDTGLNYTARYVSLVHDTANDAIVLHGSRDTWVRPFVPAAGHTIDEWQKFPRLEGWLYEGFTGYVTISGPNQFCPTNGNFDPPADDGQRVIGFDGHSFEITLDNASSWNGTITLQKCNSMVGGTAWQDVQTFTGAAVVPYPEHDGFTIWRIGCKAGDWVSGSIRVYLGYRQPAPSYECRYDSSYGGMFHSSYQLDTGAIALYNANFTPAQPNSKNMYAVTKLSPLPAYIPAPGVVKAISTNTLFNIKANPLPGNDGHGVGSIFAYNSGIVAPDYGTHGALVQPAGGGYHYMGTENYLFDFAPASLAWRMLNAPDKVVIPVGQTAYNGPGELQPAWVQNPSLSPNYDGVNGEWKDGSGNLIQPASTQGYESVDYFPPYAGGAQPYGSLLRFVNGGVPFQMNATHSFDLSANSNAGWKRAATTLVSGIQDSNFYGCHCAWHGGLRRFIALPNRDGSTIGYSFTKVWYLDMENRPSRGVGLHGTFTTTVGYQPQSGSTLIYWPGMEVVVSLGKNAAETAYAIQYYDPYDSTRAPQYVAINGMPALTGYRWGFTFYPEGQCFYAKPGATSTSTDPNAQKIWKITPPAFNWRNRAWSAQEITMGGTSSGGSDVVAGGDNVAGFSKNFGYNPKIGCIVWCAGASFPVYAYRPVP